MPHRLNAFLGSNPELRQLSGKARQLAALQRQYERAVPPSLLAGSRVMQLRQQVLVIAADNGAVAAKLRQMTSEIISLFQAMGCEVTGIQIRVQVTSRQPASRPQPRKLSKAAQDALGQLDAALTDSPLKQALQRLQRKAKT